MARDEISSIFRGLPSNWRPNSRGATATCTDRRQLSRPAREVIALVLLLLIRLVFESCW